MKRDYRNITTKWLLSALFIAYIGSITLFTHTHVINHVRYVHWHPFKKNEKRQHTHSENQLFLLAQFCQTQLTPDVVCDFDLSVRPTLFVDISIDLYVADYASKRFTNSYLRAPPVV